MSINQEFKEFLLNNIPTAKPSGSNHVICRCFLCGDSNKHSNSAHFYISLGDNDAPYMFYCQLCNECGIITPKFLMNMMSIYDTTMNIQISNHNKNKLSLTKNSKYNDNKIYYLNNYIEDSDLSRVKLNYINKRLGLNLDYSELIRRKIVLNLYDLFKVNKIETLTRDKRIVSEIDKSFIGFISKDNAFLGMRNLRSGKVYKSIDKRYVNYNIFGKFNNRERFYVLPTQINLNDYNRIRINITEGPFDILSVFYNLNNKQEYHNIYASIGGSGYLSLIKYFLLDMKLYNAEFHIYRDNDQSMDKMYIIKDIILPYNIPLYIHSNIFNGEKDFGVPIDKINDYIIKLI